MNLNFQRVTVTLFKCTLIILLFCPLTSISQAQVHNFEIDQIILDVVPDIVSNRARDYSKTKAGLLVNSGLFDASDRYPAGIVTFFKPIKCIGNFGRLAAVFNSG